MFLVGQDEVNIGAQSQESLGRNRMRFQVCNQLTLVTADRIRDLRDRAKDLQSELFLDLILILDRLVKVFEQEGQTDTKQKSN